MRARRWPLPAAAGVASVALGLGAAELAAALVAPRASPILVIGALLIDIAPSWAKETAIALFGTADKLALVIGIALVLVVLAGIAGVLQSLHPPLGRILIAAAAMFGIVAAVTRAGAAVLDAVPAIVAGIVAAAILGVLLRKLPQKREPASGEPTRRTFLAWAGGTAAVGALGVIGGTLLQSGARAVTAMREALVLPSPVVGAPPIPADADFAISGLPPVVTPNAEFYRIDTALQVPRIDPTTWSLRVTGEVENEVELTWAELLELPLQESVTTLMCVSNVVGGDLIGNAVWLGYPIRDLLKRANPASGADMVLSRSIDGFTAGTPLKVLEDERNAILAIGMNGEPLPAEHGFPVRMVVPGLYGYVSATKWVVELEVTRFSRADAYWTVRGWGERGPIKIGSRIDVVKHEGEGLLAAGYAWAQHTGISRVEVQIDNEPWAEAELAEEISIDTWVQWRHASATAPGDHILRVRATDAKGQTQTEEVTDVLPDGATGYHTVAFSL